jgi:hypothetical protein
MLDTRELNKEIRDVYDDIQHVDPANIKEAIELNDSHTADT